MTDDDVLQQVWAAKEAVAQRFNYDIRAMGRYFQSLDQPGTHPVVEAVQEAAINRETPWWERSPEVGSVEIHPRQSESVFEAAPTFEDIKLEG